MQIRSLLMAGAAAGVALSLTGTALAQKTSAQNSSASTIQALEQQLQTMETQMSYMKRQIELMQEQQKATQETAQAAQKQVADATAAVAKVAPKGGKGVQMGAVNLQFGGFIEAAGIYRDKNMTSDIDTSFNSIPFGNSSNTHVDEFRFTARQSRLSLLATGDYDPTTHLSAYYEMDFLGAAPTANSNQSNSYNLRIRNIYATIDWDDLGLHLLGGQNWSLLTMNTKGINPRSENPPLSIDAHYVVGFDWTRAPQFRLTKDLIDKQLWAAISVENPQTTMTGTAPAGAGTLVNNVGAQLFNGTNTYSIDAAPDVVAKLAWEPGFGHYELYGVASFFRDRVNFQNRTDIGGGIGAGAYVPVIDKLLDFQLSGLVGQGVGRYGTSQVPDVTFGADGSIHPLTAYSVLAGLIGHPDPSLDVYGYAGLEHADNWYENIGSAHYGYGNPAFVNSGCHTEGSPLACTANTKDIMEGTVGAWWKFYQGPMGSARWGIQYEYIARNVYGGVGGGGTADNSILMTSFRYYPF